jgi:hypothetical protein
MKINKTDFVEKCMASKRLVMNYGRHSRQCAWKDTVEYLGEDYVYGCTTIYPLCNQGVDA